MRGTALALATVITLGNTWLAMTAMAADWTTTDRRVEAATRVQVSPGPAGRIWYGGTLDPLVVTAPPRGILAELEPACRVPARTTRRA